MYIIVAGAGVVGYQITRMLVSNKHNVVVIDVDRDVCETVYAETGAMAIHGSATDISILEKAGAEKADAIVCLIRNDGDNIATVVMAKSLGVPNILALVRKPRFERAYVSAGATAIIRMADLLLNQIMMELEQPKVKKIISLSGGKAEVYAIRIPEKAVSVGMTVQEIARHKKFPRECVFVGMYNEESDDFIIPRGEHVLTAGETVCLVSNSQHVKVVTDFLTKTR
jgi:trk system potassium uptake protein TrkA